MARKIQKAPKTQSSKSLLRPSRRRVIILVICLLGLYVVLPSIGGFGDDLKSWRHADARWALAALVFYGLTYFTAAVVFLALARHKLKFFPTSLVQLAANFIDRLLPAGVGAIGVNYLYLKRHKHTDAQSVAVVATGSMLGFVGHMILLGLVVVSGQYHSHNKFTFNGEALLIGVLVLAALIGAVLVWRRATVVKFLHDLVRDIAAYRKHPSRLLVALLFAMVTTVFYSLVLYASAQALGVHISAAQTFIILTAGVAGGTFIPTPGGIGSAEAGLVAGLTLSGVSTAESVSVALFYRLITYWLSLMAGAVALAVATRKKYLG